MQSLLYKKTHAFLLQGLFFRASNPTLPHSMLSNLPHKAPNKEKVEKNRRQAKAAILLLA
jgi:hypothetical protein